MHPMARTALAVLAGMALWAVAWNLGTTWAQTALPGQLAPDQPIVSVPALLGLMAYSVVLSLLAGWTTGSLERARPMRSVAILAGIQLLLGIVAQLSYWTLMPVWYHLAFLALVVPATLAGGYLRRRAAVAA